MTSENHTFEVYHNPESLCSQKVRVACLEKDIDYTSHVIELSDLTIKGNNLSKAYRNINPNGIVPTLVHNGTPVYDSYHIIEYLDELLPNSGTKLWPDDPEKRKSLEAWLFEASLRNDAEFGETLGSAAAGLSAPFLVWSLKQQPVLHVIKTYIGHPIKKRGFGFIMGRLLNIPEHLIDRSVESMARGLVEIDRQLASHDDEWLLGPFTQIEVTFMAVFHRLQDLRLDSVLDHPGLPNVGPYWKRLQARPSYKAGILDWHNDEVRHGMSVVFADGNPRLDALKAAIGRHASQPAIAA